MVASHRVTLIAFFRSRITGHSHSILSPPGGSTLYIETALRNTETDDKSPFGSMELTGHLGDVMKESARIALTVARNYLAQYQPGNKFLNTR